MLKNDRTHQIVASNNVHTDTIQQGQTDQHAFPVVARLRYALALTWHRLDETSNIRSNLDLTFRNPSTNAALALSNTPRNLYEVVRFPPSYTGMANVEITAPSVPSGTPITYSWAWLGVDSTTRDVVSYGSGCPGAATPYEVLHDIGARPRVLEWTETYRRAVAAGRSPPGEHASFAPSRGRHRISWREFPRRCDGDAFPPTCRG